MIMFREIKDLNLFVLKKFTALQTWRIVKQNFF